MTGETNKVPIAEKIAEFAIKSAIRIGELLKIGTRRQSRHARYLPSATTHDEQEPEALVRAKEVKDADEDQLFHDIMMSFASDCLMQPAGAGQVAHFEDQHWGYTKGLLEGELDVSDVGKLPAECRVGLFALPARYPVISRPNFLNDGKKIQISRLSLKLKTEFKVPNVYSTNGQARELDLLLSEGLRQSRDKDQDGQGFFFRDARQLRYLSWFAKHPLWGILSLFFVPNSRVFKSWKRINADALDSLYLPAHAGKSWEEKDYYSAGPYALKSSAEETNGILVKFALRSHQIGQQNAKRPRPDGLAGDHRKRFDAWRETGAPAVFDLCVQVARYGAIHTPYAPGGHPCKAVMATEFADLVWDEKVSPFVNVGTLTLRAADMRNVPEHWFFDASDRWYHKDKTPAYALRFNAWNTLAEMQPVGQLFRARKQVHAFHRDTRLRHSMQAETNPHAHCPIGHGGPE